MHRRLILAGMLTCGAVAAHAQLQDVCINVTTTFQPHITPQPGGWTVKPGNGIAMNFGATPFPSPMPIQGGIVAEYVHTHNNLGRTCNWRFVDMIMFVVQSFSDSAGTQDERSDTFQFNFSTNQSHVFSIDLNDRWVKRIDLAARNSHGWSGFSNSSYGTPQHTGVRAQAELAPDVAMRWIPSGWEWRSCLVPSLRERTPDTR